MEKFVLFNFKERSYYTIHNCPYISTVDDMNAKIPWCPKVKDFPEYRVYNGGFVSHCSSCLYWTNKQDNF